MHHPKITESDALFDISIETELLTEVKDIRDELNILYTMLSDQLAVLKEMESVECMSTDD
jgi:hypothetical protein